MISAGALNNTPRRLVEENSVVFILVLSRLTERKGIGVHACIFKLNTECVFTAAARLEFYQVADLQHIVGRSASVLGLEMSEDGALEVARRARGTPRIANRLLRRVRDFAEVKHDGAITAEVAAQALDMLNVDSEGFDYMDRKLLLAVIDKFLGGPVGLDNLAAAIGEERETIEDVLEPFLIQQGFLQRTPRGRIATPRAWTHFGIVPPAQP